MAELTTRPSLGAFLSETAGRPFAWGVTDCLLRPADWVRACRGVDPAAAWRGRYASERGALRIIAHAGGMKALVGEALREAGLEQIDAPRPGDVGLIPVGAQLIGAVRTAKGWAVKTPKGVLIGDFPFVQAWRV